MASNLIADLSNDAQTNVIRSAWDHLHRIPGGRRAFTAAIGRAARYTGTIHAQIEELRDGYSRVVMHDHKKIRNHLKSVHAIALVNLAELTGNIAVSYALADDARFIVSGLSIDYLKKARGTITATCECPALEGSKRREYQVPVVLNDRVGDVVAKATLKTLIGPKKWAQKTSL